MKNLNVNWVPGTFAIVSLTIATSPQAPTRGYAELAEAGSVGAVPTTKFIVISGERELRADVRTARA